MNYLVPRADFAADTLFDLFEAKKEKLLRSIHLSGINRLALYPTALLAEPFSQTQLYLEFLGVKKLVGGIGPGE